MTSWAGVWKAIDKRRLSLGLQKSDLYRASGVSETTFRKMARNEPVHRLEKRQAIAAALQWTPDSIDLLLAGQPALDTKAVAEREQLTFRVDELERALDALSSQVDRLTEHVGLPEGSYQQRVTVSPVADVDQFAMAADADGKRATADGKRVSRPQPEPLDE